MSRYSLGAKVSRSWVVRGDATIALATGRGQRSGATLPCDMVSRGSVWPAPLSCDMEGILAKLAHEKAGEDARDVAADDRVGVDGAAPSGRLETKARIEQELHPSVDTFGYARGEQERLLDLIERHRAGEVVDV